MGNLASFRAEVRDWLETNCPESMRTPCPQMNRAAADARNSKILTLSSGWIAVQSADTPYPCGPRNMAVRAYQRMKMSCFRKKCGVSMRGPLMSAWASV